MGKGIRIPLRAFFLPDNTGFGGELDVGLHALAGRLHLFVWFGDVLGIRQLHGHLSAFSQEAVQIGEGTSISPPVRFDPEYDDSVVRIFAPYAQDKLDFFGRMLVGMAVRAVEAGG